MNLCGGVVHTGDEMKVIGNDFPLVYSSVVIYGWLNLIDSRWCLKGEEETDLIKVEGTIVWTFRIFSIDLFILLLIYHIKDNDFLFNAHFLQLYVWR